jgi:protein KRI1
LTHPRAIPTLVRRPDDTRATKRAAKAERKAAERAAQEEEMRKMKGEKRREMEKGLKDLKAEFGGVEGLDWTEVEELMEGDWEENKWDDVVGRLVEKAAEAEVSLDTD